MAFVGFPWAAYVLIFLIQILAEFNDYNLALFTTRARSLNDLIYWISQIFGALLIGQFILDMKQLSRKHRALLGWFIIFVIVLLVNIWSYFYQTWVCINGLSYNMLTCRRSFLGPTPASPRLRKVKTPPRQE